MDDKEVKNNKNHLIELIEFTDPYCTWCWGSEPVLRKIEAVYGNQVKIGYVMGGLVKDIREFYDSLNRIGGKGWNKQVAKHWLEASEAHGMPVDEKVFYDIKSDFLVYLPSKHSSQGCRVSRNRKSSKIPEKITRGCFSRKKADPSRRCAS